MTQELIRPNLVTAIVGDPKSSKTYAACTWPEPIKLFSFDLRHKPAVAKFPDKKIEVQECVPPFIDSLEKVSTGYVEFWDALQADIYEALDNKKFNTVILDPASITWEIVRYAYNEYKQRPVGKGGMAREYGEPNRHMLSIYTKARMSGVNLVTVHYFKDRWVNDTPTGERVLDGWGRTEGQADIVITTRSVTRPTTPEEKKDLKIDKVTTAIMKIASCGPDRTLTGYEQEDMNYEDLMVLLGL
jgi:hypothetical protein